MFERVSNLHCEFNSLYNRRNGTGISSDVTVRFGESTDNLCDVFCSLHALIYLCRFFKSAGGIVKNTGWRS